MKLEGINVTEVCEVVRSSYQRGTQEAVHKRQSFGLCFCESGKITYLHNSRSYVCEQGKVVLIPQGATYTILRNNTGIFPIINFTCSEQFTDEFHVFNFKSKELINMYFDDLHSLKSNGASRLDIVSTFLKLLSAVDRDGSPVSTTLQLAVNYIHKNYSNPDLSNKDISAVCGVSEITLRKIFDYSYSATPKQYLINLRITHAKAMLESNQASVSEIAVKCGYSSVYHFCRSFKNVTGMSTSDYKRYIQRSVL